MTFKVTGIQSLILLVIFAVFFTGRAWAITYHLPKDGSRIVGVTAQHIVKKGETLASIARQYDIGFLALMAANKGVDPFLPKPGYALTIPSQLILPPVPYEGIVVNLAELRLYYFEPDKHVVHVFPVGIGRIGRDTPEMETYISQKREHPTWTPPQSIRDEHAAKGDILPKVVPAGPNNPLGDYALRLAYGQGDYLIHGTNKHFGIGLRVSSGCIRMEPKNIKWLFHHVQKGEKVKVINQPIKVSLEPDRTVFLEVHEPLTRSNGVQDKLTIPPELQWWLDEYHLDDTLAKAVITAQNGTPVAIAAPHR